MNMDSSAHRYIIAARGIDGLKLQMDRPEVTVAAREAMEVPVRLQADEHNLRQRSTPIYFRTQAADAEGLSAEQAARFLGPAPQEQEHENEPGKE